MGTRIQLETTHHENGAAIDQLAAYVDEEGIELGHDAEVPTGEWVAFEVLLRDGSVFLEGMGRCQKSYALAAGFSVRLHMLQFDPSNELIFERILLAKDDRAVGGRVTGEVDLALLDDESMPIAGIPVDRSRSVGLPDVLPPAKPARRPSVVPPPTSGAKAARPSAPPRPSTPPARAVAKPSRPAPARPSARPLAMPPTPKFPTEERTDAEIAAPSDLPDDLLAELRGLTARLVAEGRVRDLAEAHALVVRTGLAALGPFLDDD